MSSNDHGLSGVQETLLIPLAARVLEHHRGDAAFEDPEAARIAQQIGANVEHYGAEWTNVQAVVGRTHILDTAVRAWLGDHPDGQVINLGAGLCTRFHRVDNGTVRWTEVDLPDVAALKTTLVDQTDRYRVHGASVLDDDWLTHVEHGPHLFLAEGLLMYLEEAEVAALLGTLSERWPGSHMWLEGISPLLLRTFGRRSRTVQQTGATFKWGLGRGDELERLVPGVRLIDEQYHTEVHPERWGWLRIFRWVRPVHTGLKVVHIQLGAA